MQQDSDFPQSEVRLVPEIWSPEECLQHFMAFGSCRKGLLYDWLWGRAVRGNYRGRWGVMCCCGVHRGNRAFHRVLGLVSRGFQVCCSLGVLLG